MFIIPPIAEVLPVDPLSVLDNAPVKPGDLPADDGVSDDLDYIHVQLLLTKTALFLPVPVAVRGINPG
jgi:hypothetical protein